MLGVKGFLLMMAFSTSSMAHIANIVKVEDSSSVTQWQNIFKKEKEKRNTESYQNAINDDKSSI